MNEIIKNHHQKKKKKKKKKKKINYLKLNQTKKINYIYNYKKII